MNERYEITPYFSNIEADKFEDALDLRRLPEVLRALDRLSDVLDESIRDSEDWRDKWEGKLIDGALLPLKKKQIPQIADKERMPHETPKYSWWIYQLVVKALS